MSTDAGNAAAPEDAATRGVASERPGLESGDPESADSATSTSESVDRGVEGSAAVDRDGGGDGGSDDDRATDGGDTAAGGADTGGRDADPAKDGFVAGLIRDSTITGLPGETGPPPAEPHAPQAQQQGDEPVGAEPPAGDRTDSGS